MTQSLLAEVSRCGWWKTHLRAIAVAWCCVSSVGQAQHELPPHEAWGTSGDVEMVLRAPVAPIAPPEDSPQEQEVAPPSHEAIVWVAGYWEWSQSASSYQWIPGIWRRSPPGRRWEAGDWQADKSHHGYARLRGRWLKVDASDQRVPLPPAIRVEWPKTAAPSRDHFWIPGTWLYRDGQYQWREGFWTARQAEWVWIRDLYLVGYDGCHFVPGYWDFLPGMRGEEDNRVSREAAFDAGSGTAWPIAGTNLPVQGTNDRWESSRWKIGSRHDWDVDLVRPPDVWSDPWFGRSGTFAPTWGNQSSREALYGYPSPADRHHDRSPRPESSAHPGRTLAPHESWPRRP